MKKFWKNVLEKIKSPVVWVAVIAQMTALFALYDTGMSEQFKTVATIIIEILTLFGILNNPNNREGF